MRCATAARRARLLRAGTGLRRHLRNVQLSFALCHRHREGRVRRNEMPLLFWLPVIFLSALIELGAPTQNK